MILFLQDQGVCFSLSVSEARALESSTESGGSGFPMSMSGSSALQSVRVKSMFPATGALFLGGHSAADETSASLVFRQTCNEQRIKASAT